MKNLATKFLKNDETQAILSEKAKVNKYEPDNKGFTGIIKINRAKFSAYRLPENNLKQSAQAAFYCLGGHRLCGKIFLQKKNLRRTKNKFQTKRRGVLMEKQRFNKNPIGLAIIV